MSKIFVGGLNYDTDRATLTEAFSTCGKILQVLILREPESGRSRGFCFIKFSSTREANNAIEKMNGVEIDGKILRVDHCTDSRETNNRNSIRDNRQEAGNFGSREQAGGNFGNSFNRDTTNQYSERSNIRYDEASQDGFSRKSPLIENQRSYGNNSGDGHGSRSNFKSDFDNNSGGSDSSRNNIKSEYDNIFGEMPKSHRDSSRSEHGSNFGDNRSSSGFQNNNGFSNASKPSNFDIPSRNPRNDYNSDNGGYQSNPSSFSRNQNFDNNNGNFDRSESSSRYQDKPSNYGEQGQNFSKRDNSYSSRDNKSQDSQDNWFSIAPPAIQNTDSTHGNVSSGWD